MASQFELVQRVLGLLDRNSFKTIDHAVQQFRDHKRRFHDSLFELRGLKPVANWPTACETVAPPPSLSQKCTQKAHIDTSFDSEDIENHGVNTYSSRLRGSRRTKTREAPKRVTRSRAKQPLSILSNNVDSMPQGDYSEARTDWDSDKEPCVQEPLQLQLPASVLEEPGPTENTAGVLREEDSGVEPNGRSVFQVHTICMDNQLEQAIHKGNSNISSSKRNQIGLISIASLSESEDHNRISPCILTGKRKLSKCEGFSSPNRKRVQTSPGSSIELMAFRFDNEEETFCCESNMEEERACEPRLSNQLPNKELNIENVEPVSCQNVRRANSDHKADFEQPKDLVSSEKSSKMLSPCSQRVDIAPLSPNNTLNNSSYVSSALIVNPYSPMMDNGDHQNNLVMNCNTSSTCHVTPNNAGIFPGRLNVSVADVPNVCSSRKTPDIQMGSKSKSDPRRIGHDSFNPLSSGIKQYDTHMSQVEEIRKLSSGSPLVRSSDVCNTMKTPQNPSMQISSRSKNEQERSLRDSICSLSSSIKQHEGCILQAEENFKVSSGTPQARSFNLCSSSKTQLNFNMQNGYRSKSDQEKNDYESLYPMNSTSKQYEACIPHAEGVSKISSTTPNVRPSNFSCSSKKLTNATKQIGEERVHHDPFHSLSSEVRQHETCISQVEQSPHCRPSPVASELIKSIGRVSNSCSLYKENKISYGLTVEDTPPANFGSEYVQFVKKASCEKVHITCLQIPKSEEKLKFNIKESRISHGHAFAGSVSFEERSDGIDDAMNLTVHDVVGQKRASSVLNYEMMSKEVQSIEDKHAGNVSPRECYYTCAPAGSKKKEIAEISSPCLSSAKFQQYISRSPTSNQDKQEAPIHENDNESKENVSEEIMKPISSSKSFGKESTGRKLKETEDMDSLCEIAPLATGLASYSTKSFGSTPVSSSRQKFIEVSLDHSVQSPGNSNAGNQKRASNYNTTPNKPIEMTPVNNSIASHRTSKEENYQRLSTSYATPNNVSMVAGRISVAFAENCASTKMTPSSGMQMGSRHRTDYATAFNCSFQSLGSQPANVSKKSGALSVSPFSDPADNGADKYAADVADSDSPVKEDGTPERCHVSMEAFSNAHGEDASHSKAVMCSKVNSIKGKCVELKRSSGQTASRTSGDCLFPKKVSSGRISGCLDQATDLITTNEICSHRTSDVLLEKGENNVKVVQLRAFSPHQYNNGLDLEGEKENEACSLPKVTPASPEMSRKSCTEEHHREENPQYCCEPSSFSSQMDCSESPLASFHPHVADGDDDDYEEEDAEEIEEPFVQFVSSPNEDHQSKLVDVDDNVENDEAIQETSSQYVSSPKEDHLSSLDEGDDNVEDGNEVQEECGEFVSSTKQGIHFKVDECIDNVEDDNEIQETSARFLSSPRQDFHSKLDDGDDYFEDKIQEKSTQFMSSPKQDNHSKLDDGEEDSEDDDGIQEPSDQKLVSSPKQDHNSKLHESDGDEIQQTSAQVVSTPKQDTYSQLDEDVLRFSKLLAEGTVNSSRRKRGRSPSDFTLETYKHFKKMKLSISNNFEPNPNTNLSDGFSAYALQSPSLRENGSPTYDSVMSPRLLSQAQGSSPCSKMVSYESVQKQNVGRNILYQSHLGISSLGKEYLDTPHFRSALGGLGDLSSAKSRRMNSDMHLDTFTEEEEKENQTPFNSCSISKPNNVRSAMRQKTDDSKAKKVLGYTNHSSDMPESNHKRYNLATATTSFIDLFHQKQAQAQPPANGKREVRVKALEAAEQAKRQEEKREHERKMRRLECNETKVTDSESVKDRMLTAKGITDKVKRAAELKMKMEQEKARKQEEEKRRKEEERRKKEAELADRKRKREDAERREREEKRKRVEEAQRLKKEQEERQRLELDEREHKRRMLEERERERKAQEEDAKRQKRIEKEKEAERRRKQEQEYKAARFAEKQAERKRKEAMLHARTHEEDHPGQRATHKKFSEMSTDSMLLTSSADWDIHGKGIRPSGASNVPRLGSTGFYQFNVGKLSTSTSFDETMSHFGSIKANEPSFKYEPAKSLLSQCSTPSFTKIASNNPMPAAVLDVGIQSYEISPYKSSSDEEDEEEDDRPKKPIPLWARKENVLSHILWQQSIDPDEIFSSDKTCSLTEIFGTAGSRRVKNFKQRGTSGDWVADHATWKEEMEYKKMMGYIP